MESFNSLAKNLIILLFIFCADTKKISSLKAFIFCHPLSFSKVYDGPENHLIAVFYENTIIKNSNQKKREKNKVINGIGSESGSMSCLPPNKKKILCMFVHLCVYECERGMK